MPQCQLKGAEVYTIITEVLKGIASCSESVIKRRSRSVQPSVSIIEVLGVNLSVRSECLHNLCPRELVTKLRVYGGARWQGLLIHLFNRPDAARA
jgi:hypothetical protein